MKNYKPITYPERKPEWLYCLNVIVVFLIVVIGGVLIELYVLKFINAFAPNIENSFYSNIYSEDYDPRMIDLEDEELARNTDLHSTFPGSDHSNIEQKVPPQKKLAFEFPKYNAIVKFVQGLELSTKEQAFLLLLLPILLAIVFAGNVPRFKSNRGAISL